jgi:hypothetical protein
MAATVAGPEPEIAAKNIHVSTAAIARPPGSDPRIALQNLIRRLEIPPVSIRLPATMKRGTASSGKESTAVKSLCTTTMIGVVDAKVSAVKLDIARTAQIGKPRMAVIANVTNIYVAII